LNALYFLRRARESFERVLRTDEDFVFARARDPLVLDFGFDVDADAVFCLDVALRPSGRGLATVLTAALSAPTAAPSAAPASMSLPTSTTASTRRLVGVRFDLVLVRRAVLRLPVFFEVGVVILVGMMILPCSLISLS
jgi:hypothetical protein